MRTFNLSTEDALSYIVEFLRSGKSSGRHGYGVWLPHIMHSYLEKVATPPVQQGHADNYPALSPPFMDAAWAMCRRGILRPGIATYGGDAVIEGASGLGFSVTPAGERWLQEAGRYEMVPIEPGRLANLLDAFGQQFGAGFRERAQEAIRCYNAHAYLACCAMCGAAAESILLALAIAKTKNQAAVEKDYLASGGRGRLERAIVGQQPMQVANDFKGFVGLLKYWRDSASHGMASNIQDQEASTAINLLLRFANFATDRWSVLTAP